jgi:hypothetical protein
MGITQLWVYLYIAYFLIRIRIAILLLESVWVTGFLLLLEFMPGGRAACASVQCDFVPLAYQPILYLRGVQ